MGFGAVTLNSCHNSVKGSRGQGRGRRDKDDRKSDKSRLGFFANLVVDETNNETYWFLYVIDKTSLIFYTLFLPKLKKALNHLSLTGNL